MRTIVLLGSLLVACSGSTTSVGGYRPTDGGSGAAADGGSSAKVEIHVRASTAAVTHSDDLSGQTPSEQKIGVRKLTMMISETDPSPLVVFDHGAAAVEAGLNDGEDTIVATVPASTLKAGTYKIARVVVSHVSYRVAATMHAVGQNVPGTFSNVHVLTDGSMIEGKTWNKGHYQFAFEVGGSVLGSQSGEDGPLPAIPSGGGLTMDTSGSETAYVFPIEIPVRPDVSGDVKLFFEINTHENFRWEDEVADAYVAGTFDVTPTAYEPVKRFGANSFRVVADLTSSE